MSEDEWAGFKGLCRQLAREAGAWVRGTWLGGLLVACAVWIVMIAAVVGLKAYSVRENGRQVRCVDCLLQYNEVIPSKLAGVAPEVIDEWQMVQCPQPGQQTVCPDGTPAIQGPNGCACKVKRTKYFLVYVCPRGHVQRIERPTQEVKSSALK